MADYLATDTELTAVANAIREKGGTSAALEWPDGYVSAIGDIETGGGSDERYITPTMPEYAIYGQSTIQKPDYSFATVHIVGVVGGTMRVETNNHYYLDSITRDDTGDSVPFTTVSTTSRGGEYTFTMPDANVTYGLYFDD